MSNVSRALRAIADTYAKHKVVKSTGHAIGDESPLAEGFADGYMRALENHGMTEPQLVTLAADMVMLSTFLVAINDPLSEGLSDEGRLQLQELLRMSERYKTFTQKQLTELAKVTDPPSKRRGQPPQEQEKQRA